MFLVGFLGYIFLTGDGTIALARLKNETFSTFGSYSLSIAPMFLLMGHFATLGGMSHALFIDIDGNKLDDNPYPINAAGYTIHSAIHAARPDLQCVLHTHSQNATAISCLEEGFMPLTQMGCMFHERIGVHEFEGIALDLAERESIVRDLGAEKHTMLLFNHGILICGQSIAHAFTRLYHFEDCAGVQLKAMAAVAGGATLTCGATLKRPRPEIVEKTREQFESGASQGGADVLLPEWPAYLRMLDRVDPGWQSAS